MMSPISKRDPMDTDLRERIEQEAQKREIPPVNARLDRVWKAIPGYNGLEVDVEKTYKLAINHKTTKDQPLLLVYRQIEPELDLSDLDPQPVYKGNSAKAMVSFMINVAWGDEFIPPILEMLNKENVHATFFFDGSWLSQHEDTARTIKLYGHELSNHGFSHQKMSQLEEKRATEEIMRTEQLLKQLDVNNRLFAPPSGDYDLETVQIARKLGLTTVLWTLDTVDWNKPSPSSIVQKISTQLEPGAIILMHPTSSATEALPDMIKAIKSKGFVMDTVSELLSSERVPMLEPNRK
ncbi:MAG: polysaccharide deacetylase family protein [Gorillibacterium sp.]|nr:polysaccharide deacetylase family protein [Gorillibacterium sp.]